MRRLLHDILTESVQFHRAVTIPAGSEVVVLADFASTDLLLVQADPSTLPVWVAREDVA